MAYIPKTDHLVFSHNDYRYTNILVNDRDLRIVDYEYSGFSFRGVDLATYVNEALYTYNHPEFPFFSLDAGNELKAEVVTEFLAEYSRVAGGDLAEI
jgi:thiamine kinase-like enzyme